jgi:hypothetical protein
MESIGIQLQMVIQFRLFFSGKIPASFLIDEFRDAAIDLLRDAK